MKVKVLSEIPSSNEESKIDQINRLKNQVRNLEKQMDRLPPRSPEKFELSKQIDDIYDKIHSLATAR